MKHSFIPGLLLSLVSGILFSFGGVVGATGENPTETVSANVSGLQATLDAKKSEVVSSLHTTLQKIQKVYDDKVKPVVETSMFKAVECLGFLPASALDVNVANIKKEYETSILEQYVLIFSDITRFSVGLVTDHKAIADSIASFQKSYLQKISSLEGQYWNTFEKLTSDFEMYYAQNKDLVYGLAEKIQKIDTIQERYSAMESAYTKLYGALDQKTSVRSSLDASKKSASVLLKGDIDDMIRRYQSTNSDIPYEKMTGKRDSLVDEFANDADIFLNEIFKSDFDYAVYLKTLVKVQDFLSQYASETSYKCSFIISSSVNWERVYLELINDLEAVTAGMQKAYTRVQSWDADQIKAIETTVISLFKDFYAKTLKAKQSAFRLYVTQLIRDAYNETYGQVEVSPAPEVSWTPYTFVKAYNKWVYALELTYLQQFLKSQGLYDGEFHGKYDPKTIEAVYKFQLQEGVITWKETNKSAYGWMWPATRAKLNQKMNP